MTTVARVRNTSQTSFGGPAQDPRYREFPCRVSGDVNRYNHREGNDDYERTRNLFRLMSPAEKQSLNSNIADHKEGIPERIARLQIEHFTKADPAYGRGVAEALGMSVPAELASSNRDRLRRPTQFALTATDLPRTTGFASTWSKPTWRSASVID